MHHKTPKILWQMPRRPDFRSLIRNPRTLLPKGRPTLSGLLPLLKEPISSYVESKLLPPDANEPYTRTRTKFLKNAYAGETAFILTCGPSVNEVCTPEILDFLQDKLVITVKQAHDLRPSISDFHLYNTTRLKEYHYPSPTIRLSIEKAKHMQRDYPAHLNYPIKAETIVDHDVDKALIGTNDYENWTLDRSYERPWGIGIMFEVGLFLPIHLGCTRILTIGFDMNQGGKYHFYRKDETSSELYARAEEFAYTKGSIPHYLSFTERLGIEVKQHSPLSDLPIPQVENLIEWYENGQGDRTSVA